jgi:dephospho-CoA kinase
LAIVIGLTGPNASGKGEVVTCLRAVGFIPHSLSDVVREEAARQGLPPQREHLIRMGNALRREHGPGVLAARILPRLDERDVVDSIRTPAEVAVLRSLPYFVLVAVDAPVETRFRRSLARARPGDPETLQEFVDRERQENSADPDAQQLRATFALADHVLDNSGSLGDLRSRLQTILDAIGFTAGPLL